jgi:hypothetical protein
MTPQEQASERWVFESKLAEIDIAPDFHRRGFEILCRRRLPATVEPLRAPGYSLEGCESDTSKTVVGRVVRCPSERPLDANYLPVSARRRKTATAAEKPSLASPSTMTLHG